MDAFWLCFVPMFVAVDAIGVLPLFVSMTEGMASSRVRRVILQSVLTASIVGLVFLVFGPMLLKFLSISVSDFMIAGGILLLSISLMDLLTGERREIQADPRSLGAVPIGVPLITGPAVLATTILLGDIHGKGLTAVTLVLNVILAGGVFLFSQPITRAIGRTGTRTVSKVASLLLAAIAVMLIRKGLAGVLGPSL